MTNPILSICIPTYNRGKFAYDAAMHILSAYKGDDIEVVISNNCSEDNTEELISQINDPRLSYYANQENLGAAYNTHLTFLRAKGRFAYLTSDEDDIIKAAFRAGNIFIRTDSEEDVRTARKQFGFWRRKKYMDENSPKP